MRAIEVAGWALELEGLRGSLLTFSCIGLGHCTFPLVREDVNKGNISRREPEVGSLNLLLHSEGSFLTLLVMSNFPQSSRFLLFYFSVPGIIGCFQALEVVKVLTGSGGEERSTMFSFF